MQGAATQVDIQMGAAILLSMFAAIILGGVGSWSGTIAGGLVIGFAEEISTLWLPSDFKLVLSLAVLAGATAGHSCAQDTSGMRQP